MSSHPALFTVRRSDPQLIPPSRPTPREIKSLSDIDDQEALRFYMPVMQFYSCRTSNNNGHYYYKEDPAKVIRAALAEALVYYYPFAGRLREVGPTRKLVVECTGEGPLFAEADADITLEEVLKDTLHPPFPFLEQLLFDIPGTSVLNYPLLLIQFTRLECGGFVLAIRFNHTMCDGAGITQFVNAVAEIARGGGQASKPSVTPVWDRDILSARNPPSVTYTHREYDEVQGTDVVRPVEGMVRQYFPFGPTEINALKRLLPAHLQRCSTFEVITACLWRCYTVALQLDPEEEVRLLCIVNARSRFNPPLVPTGYYGNAFVLPAAISTAKEISTSPLSHPLELLRKAKAEVSTADYFKSVADLMVLRGRPLITVDRSFIISDVTRSGFDHVDYGWGKPVYVATTGGLGAMPGFSFLIPCSKTPNGENYKGIILAAAICLPGSDAMKRFVDELKKMMQLGVDSKFSLQQYSQTDKHKSCVTLRSSI